MTHPDSRAHRLTGTQVLTSASDTLSMLCYEGVHLNLQTFNSFGISWYWAIRWSPIPTFSFHPYHTSQNVNVANAHKVFLVFVRVCYNDETHDNEGNYDYGRDGNHSDAEHMIPVLRLLPIIVATRMIVMIDHIFLCCFRHPRKHPHAA